MCGKEELGPSPKAKGLECHAKGLKPSLLGFGESATDLNGSVTGVHFEMISRDDVADRLESRQNSHQAVDQTRHDMTKSQVKEPQWGQEDTKRTWHTLVGRGGRGLGQTPEQPPHGSLWQTT